MQQSHQQIASNFILRSKLPNFERDQFKTLTDMNEVNPLWIDEGHISYCLENNTHYIFRSEDGKTQWTPLAEYIVSNSTDERFISIIAVEGPEALNEELAKTLKPGSIIYVISEKQHYCNFYVEGSEESEWFKPIQPDLSEYFTKNQIGVWDDKDADGNPITLLDHINDKYTSKTDLKDYIRRDEIGDWSGEEEVKLVDHIKDKYYTKEEIGDFTTSTDGSLFEYINDIDEKWEDIEKNITNLVTKDELKDYVDEKIPNTTDLVTKEELDKKGYITIDEVPVLDNIATKEELEEVDKRIDANQYAIGQILNNLEDYKSEVQEEYLPRKEAVDKYVDITTYQNNSADVLTRLKIIDENIVNLQNEDQNIKDTHTTKIEFEDHLKSFDEYKTYVEDTFVKPEEVSEKLNTYAPNVENHNKWIGSDFAGALAGKTGSEVAAANYSYNAVLDEMLFFDFTPTISEPYVEVGLAEDWQGPGSVINWHDKENRIIIVKCGTTGPDGGDFHPINWKDALISYPKGLDLSNKFTNGPIEQSDEKQSPVGFCKIKDKDGNWVHYKSEGNKYHVPAVFEQEGEYRYYLAAYFKKGDPALNNNGELVGEWNENTVVESKDYITFIATKSIYYLNDKNEWVEHGAPIWTSEQVTDHLVLKPSCQQQQSFKLPRKIKGLYIWNDVAGDYAMVPFVNQKDEDGQWTDNMIPAYFEESVDENGYYTYIYDSDTNGHRGEIKIKVTF